MARVTVRRNFSFEKIVKEAVPNGVMREAAHALAQRIERRALSGLDENNRRFAPYAPSTRERGGKSTVDLHDTGQMFRDLQPVKVTRTAFGLGFRTERSERLAIWHESGAGTLPVRKFMGVPAVWVGDIVRFIQSKLKL
jgi:hypothetical protein